MNDPSDLFLRFLLYFIAIQLSAMGAFITLGNDLVNNLLLRSIKYHIRNLTTLINNTSGITYGGVLIRRSARFPFSIDALNRYSENSKKFSSAFENDFFDFVTALRSKYFLTAALYSIWMFLICFIFIIYSYFLKQCFEEICYPRAFWVIFCGMYFIALIIFWDSKAIRKSLESFRAYEILDNLKNLERRFQLIRNFIYVLLLIPIPVLFAVLSLDHFYIFPSFILMYSAVAILAMLILLSWYSREILKLVKYNIARLLFISKETEFYDYSAFLEK